MYISCMDNNSFHYVTNNQVIVVGKVERFQLHVVVTEYEGEL